MKQNYSHYKTDFQRELTFKVQLWLNYINYGFTDWKCYENVTKIKFKLQKLQLIGWKCYKNYGCLN